MATTIKFNIALSTECTLSVTDVTGFTPTDNATGFVLEDAVTIPVDSYKISNGYFIDVLTYNKYNSSPIIVLKSEFLNIPTGSVVPIYTNNFEINLYKLTQDSIYTLNKIFIMSDIFYNTEKLTSRFDGKIVYYTDGVDIYKVFEGTPTKISLAVLLDEDRTATTLAIKSNTFVSTCYTNMCYYKLMQSLLLDGCPTCKEVDERTKNRDFLYMTLETIQYLKDLGTTSEIQRIIEALDICGGFCKTVINNNSDCGCNG